MDCHKKNFEVWYKAILEGLYSNRNAGFVILMVAFPLLERYLREKSGVHEEDLNNSFYKELVAVFPELTSQNYACHFWQVYRNGLLHQVTVSQKNRKGIKMPDGWVSNDVAAVSKDSNGDFWLHPAEFAKRVINTIEKDFHTFEGPHSVDHPLPQVRQFTNTNVLGTGVP